MRSELAFILSHHDTSHLQSVSTMGLEPCLHLPITEGDVIHRGLDVFCDSIHHYGVQRRTRGRLASYE
jgi:hypothetical protein